MENHLIAEVQRSINELCVAKGYTDVKFLDDGISCRHQGKEYSVKVIDTTTKVVRLLEKKP